MRSIFNRLWFLAGVITLTLLLAVPLAQAAPLQKKGMIWGVPLTYQIEKINRPGVDYDGLTAVYRGPKGEKTYRIFLNMANLEREASELWNEFASGLTPSQVKTGKLLSLMGDLEGMDQKIRHGSAFASKKREKMLSDLKVLERGLKYSAWHETYRTSRSRTEFVRQFVAIRLQSIEVHELSHLLDELKLQKGAGFAHQTEVRAYLTEMAYGRNPQDVLWQVASGVLHETKIGQNTDFSILKLKSTIQEASRLSGFAKADPYVCLCRLNRASSYDLAFRIYRVYQRA